MLGVSGPSPRSAAAAQAPGKPDLVRVVEQAALSVSLVANVARQKLAFQEEVVQRGNDDHEAGLPFSANLPGRCGHCRVRVRRG